MRKGSIEMDTPHSAALAAFDTGIASARNADACWAALAQLAQQVAGHRLFTVMTVDMAAGLARRAYSDNPVAYPTSGTKPIHRDRWYDIVHGEKRCFVANTLEDIAQVFPDHALIGSLGLGSVVNLPVVLKDELVATINMLHAPHHYAPARVSAITSHLSLPAKLASLAAAQFDRP
jgi:hypothetical protein